MTKKTLKPKKESRLSNENEKGLQNSKSFGKEEELTALLKKVQADFENYQKRSEKEKAECIQSSSKYLIEKLLPVLDAFELALRNTSNQEEFIKGVELIYSHLWETLEKEGLKPIKAENEKFDPYLHEALMQEASDKPENTVLEELQKGYKFKDLVLRHTKVKISGTQKKSDSTQNENKEN